MASVNGRKKAISSAYHQKQETEHRADPKLSLGPLQSEGSKVIELLNSNDIRYVIFSDDTISTSVLTARYRRYRGLSEIEEYVGEIKQEKNR